MEEHRQKKEYIELDNLTIAIFVTVDAAYMNRLM